MYQTDPSITLHMDHHSSFGGTVTYTDRYRHLSDQDICQAVYAAQVATQGLPALLAPYTVRESNVIPTQRTSSE